MRHGIRLVNGREHWHQSVACARARNWRIPSEPPALALAALFLWQGLWVFGASIGAIEIEPDILIYEWLVTSHELPMRVRHACVFELMRAGRIYAVCRGKVPRIIAGHAGVEAMARRAGLATRSNRCVLLEGELT